MPKKVKMHSGCIDQAKVALRRAEPPAPKCRCKKLIDFYEADTLVKQGAAKWVVIKRTRGAVEVTCTFCAQMTDAEKKTCAKCKGTGLITENKIWEDFNNDIVLLGDDKEGFKEKTPRVATIEEEHIEGAYVYDIPYVLDRIKEYASMIQESLGDFGAELTAVDPITQRREIVKPGRPEPVNKKVGHPPGTITFKDGTKNKAWWWELEGRDVDYGRAI